jgi:hypothetical protein
MNFNKYGAFALALVFFSFSFGMNKEKIEDTFDYQENMINYLQMINQNEDEDYPTWDKYLENFYPNRDMSYYLQKDLRKIPTHREYIKWFENRKKVYFNEDLKEEVINLMKEFYGSNFWKWNLEIDKDNFFWFVDTKSNKKIPCVFNGSKIVKNFNGYDEGYTEGHNQGSHEGFIQGSQETSEMYNKGIGIAVGALVGGGMIYYYVHTKQYQQLKELAVKKVKNNCTIL